jgi:hypothetical protein
MAFHLTLATAALSTASASVSVCSGSVCSCRTGTCAFPDNNVSVGEPFLFCLRSEPLSPFRLLGAGSRLFAFDEVTVTYTKPVRIVSASDDTRFSDLFYSEAADVRALAEANALPLSGWSSSFADFLGGSATRQSFVFSPHYDSCLAIRSFSAPAEVTVQFKRRAPGDRDELYAAGGFKNRLASIAAGALLLITAGYLAHSTAFHYGAGIALSMLLGLAIVSLPAMSGVSPAAAGDVGDETVAYESTWAPLLPAAPVPASSPLPETRRQDSPPAAPLFRTSPALLAL